MNWKKKIRNDSSFSFLFLYLFDLIKTQYSNPIGLLSYAPLERILSQSSKTFINRLQFSKDIAFQRG